MPKRKAKRRGPVEYRIEITQEFRLKRSDLEKQFDWEKQDILFQWDMNMGDDYLTDKQIADHQQARKLMQSLTFDDFMNGWFLPGYPDYVQAENGDPADSDVYDEFITQEMDSISRGYLKQARRMRLAIQKNARKKK